MTSKSAVGAASGGVWKTTDGGLTFEPLFDGEPIASTGDLALAPSNPEVVYVGSGESNVRNRRESAIPPCIASAPGSSGSRPAPWTPGR